MTTFDRIERRLPELIDELGSASMPDYFDDMLRATAPVRQRPAWSSLERWLPMGVIALPAPTRRMPWRYLALAGAVLLIATAALVYVGSRRPAVPPPFGPARNGVIVYGTADGDIATLDPVTGTSRTIIGGASAEKYPAFSLDGTRLVFSRTTADPATEADFLAAADGSNVRPLVSGASIKWYDESGSGDRALVSRIVGPAVVQSMIDLTTGRETAIDIDPSLGITIGMFRPGHDQVVYEHVSDDQSTPTTIYLARGDGTGPLQRVPISPDAINEAWLSPDGSRLAYTSWGSASSADHGRIHVADLDTGKDGVVPSENSAGTIDLFPQFSPDGTQLALIRFDETGFQATIVPADGRGPAIGVGPKQPPNSGNAKLLWSPDGSELLVSYETDRSVWLLPAGGGDGRKLDGMDWDRGISWQRLAP